MRRARAWELEKYLDQLHPGMRQQEPAANGETSGQIVDEIAKILTRQKYLPVAGRFIF